MTNYWIHRQDGGRQPDSLGLPGLFAGLAVVAIGRDDGLAAASVHTADMSAAVTS